jgi:hypothetical protein
LHGKCAYIDNSRFNLQMLVWLPLQCKEDIMLTTQTSGSISIQPGGMLHFINRGRQRLSFNTSSGFLWLTRDGDIKDYVLRAGDAISLCIGDDVWLTLENADRPGAVTLEPLDTPLPLWRSVAALFSARRAQPCRAVVQPGAVSGGIVA